MPHYFNQFNLQNALSMTNNKTGIVSYLFFAALLLCVNTLQAQTIHAIIFAATDDATIGNGTQKSYDLISREVENVLNQTGMKSKLYYKTGDSFSLGSYQSVMADLETEDLSNDVVLFYFLGHGFQSDNPYPSLLFQNTTGAVTEQQLDEAAVNLDDIRKELQQKNARLTLLIGEACNNELDLDNIQYKEDTEVVSNLTPPLASEKKFRRLFLEAEGMIMASSSRSGQPSYISSTEGGAFTQSFLRALRRQTQKSTLSKASWIKLFDDTRSKTKKLAKKKKFSTIQTPQFQEIEDIRYKKPGNVEPPGKRPRVTFWTRLVAFVAPNKVEKSFNRALKQGDLLDLETILARQGEKGDRIKMQMLKKNPVTFYMAQAIIFEEKQDTVKALMNYSIAYELGKDNRTKRDQALINKIIKLNSKHRVVEGLNEARNYQTWLKGKLEQQKASFENDISDVETNIVTLKNEIDNIEANIDQDRSSISDMQSANETDKNRIKDIEKEIKKIDVKRSQKVEIKLTSLKKDSKQTLEKISALMDKIERDGVVDNQKTVTIDDATVEFQFAKRNTAASLEPTATGYQLGKHCTPDISNMTESLMDILLRPVDDVPKKSRSELVVKVKIIGNADWTGSGKTLNINYIGEEDIFQEYTNKDGESKVFNIDQGDAKKISNEELAFLRGYCSYKIIKRILDAKGINDYRVKFQAIEHERPEALNDGKDPGAPYRGVNIDLTIENLFKHYLDKIKELEEEIENIEDGIAARERNIRDIRRDIKEKETLIDEKNTAIAREEAKKAKLQEILNDAEIKQGLNSYVKDEIEKVRNIQLLKK